jgi:hypothetical protein
MSRRWTNEELIAAGKGWAEKHGELRFDDWRRTAPAACLRAHDAC